MPQLGIFVVTGSKQPDTYHNRSCPATKTILSSVTTPIKFGIAKKRIYYTVEQFKLESAR